jgi:hypothetical protein
MFGMGRIFKKRHFVRWMHKAKLTDRALCAVVFEKRVGLIYAELGGAFVQSRGS